MLPEEQAENIRYFYELASGAVRVVTRPPGGRAGISSQIRAGRQDRHRRAPAGQQGHRAHRRGAGAAGGHGGSVAGDVSGVPRVADVAAFVAGLRERSGGIPFGAKLSAQHIEEDIDAALEIGVDYIILDGRGGGTGAAPKLFRDHISVPTIPALARARRHLDDGGVPRSPSSRRVACGRPADLAKALALGADAVAIAELGTPGDRLRRNAGLQHRQLPGRDRHAEARAACPAAGRHRRGAARALS